VRNNTLAAASDAQRLKHRKYDAECARHGWKMVPFVLETYGAKGAEARQLLQRLAPHSIDRSPEEFLAHAERVLSVVLQVGNATVAPQATADLYLQKYRRGAAGTSGHSCGPNHHQRRRTATELREARTTVPDSFARFAHAGMHAARIRSSARREHAAPLGRWAA
jgi:hypothetical protein